MNHALGTVFCVQTGKSIEEYRLNAEILKLNAERLRAPPTSAELIEYRRLCLEKENERDQERRRAEAAANEPPPPSNLGQGVVAGLLSLGFCYAIFCFFAGC